eukprot:752776-Hanusia_phi.AAC.3
MDSSQDSTCCERTSVRSDMMARTGAAGLLLRILRGDVRARGGGQGYLSSSPLRTCSMSSSLEFDSSCLSELLDVIQKQLLQWS